MIVEIFSRVLLISGSLKATESTPYTMLLHFLIIILFVIRIFCSKKRHHWINMEYCSTISKFTFEIFSHENMPLLCLSKWIYFYFDLFEWNLLFSALAISPRGSAAIKMFSILKMSKFQRCGEGSSLNGTLPQTFSSF